MKTYSESGIRPGTKTAEKEFWKNSEVWKVRDYESSQKIETYGRTNKTPIGKNLQKMQKKDRKLQSVS